MVGVLSLFFGVSCAMHAMDKYEMYEFTTSDWGLIPFKSGASRSDQISQQDSVCIRFQDENLFNASVFSHDEYNTKNIALLLKQADEGYIIQGISDWIDDQKQNIIQGKKSKIVDQLTKAWLEQWLIDHQYTVAYEQDSSLLLKNVVSKAKVAAQMEILQYLAPTKKSSLVLSDKALQKKADSIVTQLKHKHFMQTTMLCTTFFGMGFLLRCFMRYESKKM